MKKIPIGISDFKKLIMSNCYFIDKSLIIKDLIDSGSEITLITRPRRFGKTINMSMLKYYFEDISHLERVSNFQDNSEQCNYIEDNSLKANSKANSLYLFKDLEVLKQGEKYLSYAGKYPVIYLTFKDIKDINFESCYENIKLAIVNEFIRHEYLLKSDKLMEHEKKKMEKIISEEGNESEYKNSLAILAKYLYSHYKKQVIILIDEYDTPIQSGYNNGYFDEITNFTRTFFGAGLKDNNNLYKGVLTGILRVAKESIFSDMNNLDVCTILNHSYSDKFGFTQNEVDKILEQYNLKEYSLDIKNWYNGYKFGLDTFIYNPWSILNYIKNYKEGFKPYWANSSDNIMLRDLLNLNILESKEQIESLITGGYLDKAIEENIIYQDININSDVVWSFLTHTGYLKVIDKFTETFSDGTILVKYRLSVPNIEIKMVYKNIIKNWFRCSLANEDIVKMINSLLSGNIEEFERYFSILAMRVFSYHDTAKTPLEKEIEEMKPEVDNDNDRLENFYHGVVLGLLVYVNDSYYIESNKESGLGRCDVTIIPKSPEKKGFILEFKRATEDETIEKAAKRALKQIQDKKYDEGMKNKGITDIINIGIGFKGKIIKVVYK